MFTRHRKTKAMTRRLTVIGALVANLVLVGCASTNNANSGAGMGALSGGLLGSLMGSSQHKERNALIGAVLGAGLGYAIGNEMDKEDRAKLNTALETGRNNETIIWENPDNGNTYRVTPKSSYEYGGAVCREATMQSTINGKDEIVVSTACRQGDGSWKLSKVVSSNKKVTIAIKPNLSGFWKLNKELSDEPREILQQAMQESRNFKSRSEGKGRGGFGRRGMRSSGRMVSREGGTFGGRGQRPLQGLSEFIQPTEQMEIIYEKPVLNIVQEDGRKRRFYTDNRGASISASGGLQQKVTTAGWEKTDLIIETTSDGGPRIIERYSLDSSLRQLNVAVQVILQNRSAPASYRLVYDQDVSKDLRGSQS